MACGCATYECLEVLVNPCLASVGIGVNAVEDGEVSGMIYFNGIWTTFNASVTQGQQIYLPTELFNEDYVHELRLTQANEQTCYKVKTLLSLYNSTPIIDNSMWNWAAKSGIAPGTMIVEDERLTGDISPEIWNDGSGFDWAQNGVVQTASGLDFTSIGGIQGKLTWQYRNLPI
jgi:hypothetical protein